MTETRKNDILYNLGSEIKAAKHGITLMAKSGRDDADANMVMSKELIENLHNLRVDLLHDKISDGGAEDAYHKVIYDGFVLIGAKVLEELTRTEEYKQKVIDNLIPTAKKMAEEEAADVEQN